MFLYQAKNNTVLLLPQTTINSSTRAPLYAPKDPKLKQYRTAFTPLASNQYSIRPKRPQVKTVPHCTYPSRVKSVQYIRRPTLISHTNYCPLFLPALRSTLFLPEIRTLRQVANKLHGYIYTIPTIYIYIYIAVISTSSGHPWTPAPAIYFNAVISTFKRHGTATFGAARASQGQVPSAMFLFFYFLCFISFSRCL